LAALDMAGHDVVQAVEACLRESSGGHRRLPSTTAFICDSPCSKAPPIILSMLMTRWIALATKFFRPVMVHVTAVCSPRGSKVNSAMLLARKGFSKSSLIRIRSLDRLSVIVMRPSPTWLLPDQAYIAPAPDGAPSQLLCMPGSSLSQVDHAADL